MTQAHKKPLLVAVTGKIASGKDTIGKALMARLDRTDALHTAFAAALKQEVTEIISIIRRSQSADLTKEEALGVLQERFADVPEHHLITARDAMWDEIAAGMVEDGYTRTDGVRHALQLWGTDVRRAQNDNYWVEKTMNQIMPVLKSGTSVLVTDVRFPNEAVALQEVGGIVVRLDVSRETQVERLLKRDGTVLTPEKEFHKSEVSLDDYDDFDLRVDNNDMDIDEVVDLIIEELPVLSD